MNRQQLLNEVLTSILNGRLQYTAPNGTTVWLPAPQSAGTITQNNTYNRAAAERVVEIITGK
jgi:DNA-binding transcriptional MocR family regulator